MVTHLYYIKGKKLSIKYWMGQANKVTETTIVLTDQYKQVIVYTDQFKQIDTFNLLEATND